MTRLLSAYSILGSHPSTKVALILLFLVFSLHLTLTNSSPFSFFPRHSFLSNNNHDYYEKDHFTLKEPRANATMLMLARNSDLYQALQSVRAIQDRFNARHRYPWVFLNEVPFTKEFKNRMRDIILGPAPPRGRSKEEESRVEFGLIPHDHWFQPDWIDEVEAASNRWHLVFKGIIYAGDLHLCLDMGSLLI